MVPVVCADDVCVTVAAVADMLVKGVVPPTAPVNVVVPDPPAVVNANAPFKVLLKEILALLEVMVLVPSKVTGLGNVRALAPETVTLFVI